jgi:hypothetical protein
MQVYAVTGITLTKPNLLTLLALFLGFLYDFTISLEPLV